MQDVLSSFTGECIKVHRFRYRDTGKPIPVVKLTCPTANAQTKILETGLSIWGVDIIAEPFHYYSKKELTCFGCGKKGHISRDCK